MPDKLLPGLVSVTFRDLAVDDVVKLAADNGLVGIEWGGDAHVPPGDVAAAERARALTADGGLAVAAYGSYYRTGHEGDEDVPNFDAVLDSAEALGAPVIRVWAGRREAAAGDPYREQLADDVRRVVGMADARNVRVACEWHAGTLTADADGGRWLLDNVPRLLTYWQPSNGKTHETRLAELDVVRSQLAHVHVFHWLETPDGRDRRPLAEGEASWSQFLHVAVDTPLPEGIAQRYAMLEFVRNDDPQQARDDAATLRRLLDEA